MSARWGKHQRYKRILSKFAGLIMGYLDTLIEGIALVLAALAANDARNGDNWARCVEQKIDEESLLLRNFKI